MAIIYPHFLQTILKVYENLQQNIPYPFFDSSCIRYEALRSSLLDKNPIQPVIQKYGLSEYEYRKNLSAFQRFGVAGLIGLDFRQLIEEIPLEVERMVFVLKNARPWIPATKMSIIIKGFDYDIPVSLMRHLYASYGWTFGSKPYKLVDFWPLNLKVIQLCRLQTQTIEIKSFFHEEDSLQTLLEVFRTLEIRGITKRYPGSRVSFEQHKKDFLSFGLLGLVDRARPPFRNSKLGFKEEGLIILSKIQKPQKGEAYYLKILKAKKINVDATCLSKIFTKWKVKDFKSKFKGDIERLMEPEPVGALEQIPLEEVKEISSSRLDRGFISLIEDLEHKAIPLANPGVFLFLPYLNRLKLFEKAASLFNADPHQGYSWFSLLLLDLGRILEGLSSVSKTCRTHELSIPLMAGLVKMPCKDSLLNGLAIINDTELLRLRRYLTGATFEQGLTTGKRIAFDFHMRDFSSDDVELKNIGKGPSPKRKICFPGFRPHIAWDVATGVPITLEFRNGRARATSTIKRFIRELLLHALGDQAVEHVYLDSEYTSEAVWKFIVDAREGLGAELTMCIKQNKKVKAYIDSFLKTNPTWLFYDEDHTYTEQSFEIPIQQTDQILRCVVKRKESTGRLRCFGSTLEGLTSKGILEEYGYRWIIENGIKDLIANYFFDNIPGIDPHRINIHYFVVTLARILYEMLCRDYTEAWNSDKTKKTIGTLRPEFLTGSNAIISRVKNELVLKWQDSYPIKQHHALKALFDTLNEKASHGLTFLGGLRLRFEIAPPKSPELRNKLKREVVEF